MRRRGLLWVSASLWPLFLALVWYQVRAGHGFAPPAAGDSRALNSDLSFLDLTERVRGRGGEVLSRFEAGRVDVQAGGDYLLYDLRRAEFLRNGKPDLSLTAQRARIDQRTHNLALAGAVVATSAHGAKFWAESAFWFDAPGGEGKLVVPTLDRLEYRESGAKPDAPPAEIRGQRLFFWPGQGRVDLPDGLTLTRGTDRVSAAAGSALIDRREVQLKGPVSIDARVPNPDDKKAGPTHVLLSVGPSGGVAYDQRSGAARLSGGVTVDLPEDGVRVLSQAVAYSGRAGRRLEATGQTQVTDPASAVSSDGVVVELGARRASFSGGVHLVHRTRTESTTLDAPRLVYHWPKGARRAEATGGAKLETGEASAQSDRLNADLEHDTAVLLGAVKLVTRPTPAPAGASEAEQAKHRPVTIGAERLVHRYKAGERRTEGGGGVRFVQGDRQGTAQRLAFNHDKQFLWLAGDVRLWNREGERARCGCLSYDLERDELRVERPVAAEFFLREQD